MRIDKIEAVREACPEVRSALINLEAKVLKFEGRIDGEMAKRLQSEEAFLSQDWDWVGQWTT